MIVDSGLMGMKDYWIVFEVVLVGVLCMFLYFMYLYGFGMVGWMVMKIYFVMVGSDKVGFMIVGVVLVV